ncbi:alpha/beta hydrolase [Lysobacter terrestris]|uniref:Alpha/beta hydrolase n=2 Tax=Agrilutibacter terrestris TaxID=2865112 RepID=A0A7H0G1H3_9GAMM|nr:alpha/beta hydrolase [Lysobacter terrestris]
MRNPSVWLAAFCVAVGIAATAAVPDAAARGRVGERLAERMALRRTLPVDPAALPANVRVWRERAYGSDPAQRYDVYAPRGATHAPTLFLVHGGGWKRGDKAAANVVAAKVEHWTAQGYVVISANYRMLPAADPLLQARDVAAAVAAAQRDSAQWGGDAGRFVLMGHSAGAHLSALLAASPDLLAQANARPVRGAVLLDSAMLDTARLMAASHGRLYDEAFGDDPAYWRATSPYAQLRAPGVPLLAVCSSRRIESCAQARDFVAHATRLGRRAQASPQALSHGAINAELGQPSAYTATVDRFLRSL